MKIAMLVLLSTFSFQIFSAEIKSCSMNGNILKNVVVPSKATSKSIEGIILSSKSREEKISSMKNLLYVDGLSVGDGKSFCELSLKAYNANEEKCLRVLRTDDVLNQLLVDNSDVKDLTIECLIGLELGVQLGFRM